MAVKYILSEMVLKYLGDEKPVISPLTKVRFVVFGTLGVVLSYAILPLEIILLRTDPVPRVAVELSQYTTYPVLVVATSRVQVLVSCTGARVPDSANIHIFFPMTPIFLSA